MLQTIIAGLTAGAVHVLAGPDHLAAVAPLAANGKVSPWRSGLYWGLGHAGGDIVCAPGDGEGGGGVQDDDIARGARLPGQYGADGFG